MMYFTYIMTKKCELEYVVLWFVCLVWLPMSYIIDA